MLTACLWVFSMGSKSQATDATSTATETTLIDRKAVQQQGQQILDSLIIANDDKVVKEAMAGVTQTFDSLTNGNAATVAQLRALSETVLTYINKGQADISAFGLSALEKARQQLDQVEKSGNFIIKIADESIGKALNLAEQVTRDQANANRQALDIVADTKTGDFADLTRYLTASVLGFTLLALYIVRKKT